MASIRICGYWPQLDFRNSMLERDILPYSGRGPWDNSPAAPCSACESKDKERDEKETTRTV